MLTGDFDDGLGDGDSLLLRRYGLGDEGEGGRGVGGLGYHGDQGLGPALHDARPRAHALKKTRSLDHSTVGTVQIHQTIRTIKKTI